MGEKDEDLVQHIQIRIIEFEFEKQHYILPLDQLSRITRLPDQVTRSDATTIDLGSYCFRIQFLFKYISSSYSILW